MPSLEQWNKMREQDFEFGLRNFDEHGQLQPLPIKTMNTFPYIILLSGKLFVIELPEKPDRKDFGDGINELHHSTQFQRALKAYESARSAAIGKAVEIENSEIVYTSPMVQFHRKFNEGEEVRWPGTLTYHKIYPCRVKQKCLIADVDNKNNCAQLHGNQCQKAYQVARLTEHAQKLEFTNEELRKTKEREQNEEELKELNYPRNHAIDFATWYSGMERVKVDKAYNRYVREKSTKH